MKSAFFHSIYTYLVLGLLSFVFFNLSVFDFIGDAFRDFSYLDLVQSKNIFKYEKVNTDIILINIENRDREELAFLIDHISNQQPKVIGIDIIFKEEREKSKDSILSSVLKKYDSILVTSYIHKKVYNIKKFRTITEGFINFNIKEQEDSVIRNFITNDNKLKSFAFQVASKATKNDVEIIDKIRTIKYIGNYKQFLHVKFDDIMSQENIPFIKDKIILLGYLGLPLGNENDILDKKFTPINSKFSGKSIPDMYGVTIHANIINSLVKKDFIKTIPPYIIFILSFLMTIFISYIFLELAKKDYPWDGLLTKVFQLIYTFIILWVSIVFFKKSIKLPVTLLIACPMLAIELIPYGKSIHNYIYKKWNIKSMYN